MKRLLLLALALIVAKPVLSQTTLLLEDFEDGTVGYTTSITEFTDSGQDYFTRTDGSNITGESFNGTQGSFYFGAQDIDGEGATLPVSMTFSGINISGQSDVFFNALFAEDATGASEHYDSADYVRVFASIDGGGEIQIFGIEGSGGTNTAPFVDTNLDGTGNGTEITDTFALFSVAVGGTGNTLTIRIEFNLNAGDEDIAIDNVTITAGGALPVELTSFDAVSSTNRVTLNWTTASETNNSGFEVQQAQGDGTFIATSFVQGHGTTLEAQSYQHTATNLIPGTYRFRLKQVDFDGAFEYSPEIEVSVGIEHSFRLSEAYPNPFNPETVFSVSVQTAQQVEVVVYDLLGRQVQQLFSGALGAGEAKPITFEAANLPGGVYLIQARGAEVMQSRTVTLLK